MSEKITPCECPMAGFCNRHGVQKSAHLHKLCKGHIGYFTMWEECRGPNQNPNDCVKQSENRGSYFKPEDIVQEQPKKNPQLPSTMQMAKNFVKSAAKHAQSGFAQVDSDMQKQRLQICNDCEFIVQNKSRCGKCGCFLETKTKWKTSSCPIGKW